MQENQTVNITRFADWYELKVKKNHQDSLRSFGGYIGRSEIENFEVKNFISDIRFELWFYF